MTMDGYGGRFVYRFSLLVCCFCLGVNSVQDCEVTPCPRETPYCTAAGCVSKCPANSFANYTRCVLNCGDMMTDGNMCKNVCPKERQFTKDNIIVVGGTFQRVHYCVESCDLHVFAFEKTCVSACPADVMYVVNRECKPTCPDNLPLRFIKQTITNYTYVECSKVCHGDKPVLKNQTCVSKCDDGEVIFEGLCVDECPDGFDYLQLSKGVDIKAKVCVKDCGDDFYFGRDCVQFCPAEMLVAKKRYSYNECVNKCSDDQVANGSVCIDQDDCKQPYVVHDEKCLDECPDGTLYIMNTPRGVCETQLHNYVTIVMITAAIVIMCVCMKKCLFQPFSCALSFFIYMAKIVGWSPRPLQRLVMLGKSVKSYNQCRLQQLHRRQHTLDESLVVY